MAANLHGTHPCCRTRLNQVKLEVFPLLPMAIQRGSSLPRPSCLCPRLEQLDPEEGGSRDSSKHKLPVCLQGLELWSFWALVCSEGAIQGGLGCEFEF